MPRSRRIQFQGDDASYIRFLEARIFELESKLQSNRRALNQGSQESTHPSEPSYEPCNQIRGLEVIECHPQLAHTVSEKKDSGDATRLRWQSNLDDLLEDIPRPCDWAHLGHASQLKSTRILNTLIRGAATYHSKGKSVLERPSEEPSIITLLHHYRDLTIHASLEGEFLRRLACFRELVFVSLCAVALKVEDDKAGVFEVMRSYIGSKAQEKHLMKQIRGAVWANSTIFALSKSAWGSKCSFCFFLGWWFHIEKWCFFHLLTAGSRTVDFFLCTLRRVFRKPVVLFRRDAKEIR